jgi:ribonucleoside-diphosphate reductase alpha chain
VNLFLADNDARKASFMYREAWDRGLKTTYYLRTINKSGIDSGNRERKKSASAAEAVAVAEAKACSIEAMRNGTTCEACQ